VDQSDIAVALQQLDVRLADDRRKSLPVLNGRQLPGVAIYALARRFNFFNNLVRL